MELYEIHICINQRTKGINVLEIGSCLSQAHLAVNMSIVVETCAQPYGNEMPQLTAKAEITDNDRQ